MIPRASLQGRVLDPEGKPAPGITVTLDSFGMSAITDEDGAFKIENLKPGTSRLSAKPKSQSQAQPKNGERTVTTYYPSIIDSTQAAWIQVQGMLALENEHAEVAELLRAAAAAVPAQK
jgi:protocatechuate 3,4-dioxygenase beta subunit